MFIICHFGSGISELVCGRFTHIHIIVRISTPEQKQVNNGQRDITQCQFGYNFFYRCRVAFLLYILE